MYGSPQDHSSSFSMSKYSLKQYLLGDLKHCARYPPANRYVNEKRVRKTKEEYSDELENLTLAHPRTSADDIEKGVWTHTLMTGGKFLFNDEPIPSHIKFPKAFGDLHRAFRDAAPRLLGRKETYQDLIWLIIKHTIVNKRSWEPDACLTEGVSKPYHRFFLDLDLVFAQEHASIVEWNAFIRTISLCIGKAVLSCYPHLATSQDPTGQFEFSILCTKGYRPKTLSETENRVVVKRGIHMVWPGLIVDKDQSECLARLIDEILTKEVPRDLTRGENTWKDAIDLSVYKSGLRPVGCVKMKPCARCRPLALKRVPGGMTHDSSAFQMDYDLCHPRGFINQGEESIYSLDYIARADGVVFTKANVKLRLDSHVLKDDVTGREFDFSLLTLTSIRTNATEPTPGFEAPSHLRQPVNELYTDYRVHVKQDPETGDYLPPPKRAKSNVPRNSHLLILSNAQMDAINVILQGFHPKYAQIVVDKVWAFPTKDPKKMLPPRVLNEAPKRTLYSHLSFSMKGEMSTYCFNKGGFHQSNTIRFVLDYHGNISQTCWSTKVYHGKPCCRLSTLGTLGYMDKWCPRNYSLLVDIFTTKAN